MAQRRKHTGPLKARAALEAITGPKTVNEISAEYGVHASQIHKWKKEALERLTAWLRRQGLRIGHNRVRRLLRLMGLTAVYPKRRLSRPGGLEHRLWPYLLRDLTIDRPNPRLEERRATTTDTTLKNT